MVIFGGEEVLEDGDGGIGVLERRGDSREKGELLETEGKLVRDERGIFLLKGAAGFLVRGVPSRSERMIWVSCPVTLSITAAAVS